MMIKQEHARILREALARLTKMGNPFVTGIAVKALQDYAKNVRPYCECKDVTFIEQENKSACLDCGKRHNVDSEGQIFIAPPPPPDKL